MISSPVLDAIAGVVHGFGSKSDDMERQFPAYWAGRPIQHEWHGIRIAVIERAGEDCGEADGMFTELPGAMLAIATADCAPVLMARRDGIAVAALHVGWRGALAGIVPAFGALLAARGERPGDWVAAIGPTAGPCCYQVSEDIIDSLRERHGIDAHVVSPGGRYLDLAGVVRWQLDAAGFGQVRAIEACTICHLQEAPDTQPGLTFHSYRRDRETRIPGVDVQWSVIAIAATTERTA